MSDVPDEVLREILSRLTVTPLLRFRCVCKSWKCLIDSDQFIKDHLNHSRKSNSNLSVIIRKGYLYSADFDDLLTDTNPGTFQELFHPLKTPDFDTEILGSCDGLLVLSNGEEENILWNPSTRRFQNIPVTDMEFPTDYASVMQYIVYGFGYDALSDDYKLVRIVQYYAMGTDECDAEVKVYSMKSNSWKRIPNFPYFLGVRRRNAELVNGALHWAVSRIVEPGADINIDSASENLVAAFDLGTEDYRLVSLPEFTGGKLYMNVGVLAGCLILMCDYHEDYVDIWEMKEYGIQESWSRLFTVTRSDVCYKSVDFLMPLAYSNCGRKVLLRFDSFVTWYDLNKESADLPMVQIPYEGSFLLHTCLKSLVSLNNGVCDFDIVAKNVQEKNKDKDKSSRIRAGWLSLWFGDVKFDFVVPQ